MYAGDGRPSKYALAKLCVDKYAERGWDPKSTRPWLAIRASTKSSGAALATTGPMSAYAAPAMAGLPYIGKGHACCCCCSSGEAGRSGTDAGIAEADSGVERSPAASAMPASGVSRAGLPGSPEVSGMDPVRHAEDSTGGWIVAAVRNPSSTTPATSPSIPMTSPYGSSGYYQIPWWESYEATSSDLGKMPGVSLPSGESYRLDGTLEANGIPTASLTVTSDGILALYTCPKKFRPKKWTLRTEILWRMLRSGRAFSFVSFKQLSDYIWLRDKIVSVAKEIADRKPFAFGSEAPIMQGGRLKRPLLPGGWTFGYESDGDANAELNYSVPASGSPFRELVQRGSWEPRRIGCFAARMVISLRGVELFLPSIFDSFQRQDANWVIRLASDAYDHFFSKVSATGPDDWVPGDGGYVENKDLFGREKHSPLEEGDPSALYGENLIYVGGTLDDGYGFNGSRSFYTHPAGLLSLTEVYSAVLKWSLNARDKKEVGPDIKGSALLPWRWEPRIERIT